jgi:hypothetical protein
VAHAGGAIASYVLSNARSHVSSIALTFPALMNAGFAVLFFYSIGEAKRLMCGVATVGILVLMALIWWAPNWSPR